MNFKEQLETDLDVFLNPDEFGEIINLDGRDVNGIMEGASESVKTASSDGFANASGLSLFSHDVTLYVKESDMEKKLVPGDKLYINDLAYNVSDSPNSVTVQDGLLIIMLAKYSS